MEALHPLIQLFIATSAGSYNVSSDPHVASPVEGTDCQVYIRGHPNQNPMLFWYSDMSTEGGLQFSGVTQTSQHCRAAE